MADLCLMKYIVIHKKLYCIKIGSLEKSQCFHFCFYSIFVIWFNSKTATSLKTATVGSIIFILGMCFRSENYSESKAKWSNFSVPGLI